jgi:hypothetical protein
MPRQKRGALPIRLNPRVLILESRSLRHLREAEAHRACSGFRDKDVVFLQYLFPARIQIFDCDWIARFSDRFGSALRRVEAKRVTARRRRRSGSYQMAAIESVPALKISGENDVSFHRPNVHAVVLAKMRCFDLRRRLSARSPT